MANQKKKSVSANYYSPYMGALRIRKSHGGEGITTRLIEKKNGEKQTIHEEVFDSVSGLPLSIYIDTKEFHGTEIEFLTVVLFDPESKMREVIQSKFDNDFTSDFLKRLPDVDLKRPVTIKAFTMDNEKRPGFKVNFLIPYQFGKKIERNKTIELPKWESRAKKNGKKGELEWDRSLELDYFRNLVEKKKNELLSYWKDIRKKKEESEFSSNDSSMSRIDSIINDMSFDDLPF